MDFRSGTELFHLERMFGSGGAGVFEREKSSHKIWTQANSFWFEDASSLESCAQLSKTKSLGIPVMSNIYILKDFFFPMKFDPDYKNSLLYWMCQNAAIALPKCLCSQTMWTISVSAKSSTKGSVRYWSFCYNKHAELSLWVDWVILWIFYSYMSIHCTDTSGVFLWLWATANLTLMSIITSNTKFTVFSRIITLCLFEVWFSWDCPCSDECPVFRPLRAIKWILAYSAHEFNKRALGVESTQHHRAKSWQSWDEGTDPQLLNRHPWGSPTHAAAAKLEV